MTRNINSSSKLAIVAHLPHYKEDKHWYAFEPYVREIELWAELFKEITIYTDVHKCKPIFSLKQLPTNCKVRPIYLKSGSGYINNIIRLIQLPLVFVQVLFLYPRYDIIHTRTSGFSTLFINLLNLIFNKPTIEKWATNYPPDKGLGIFMKVYAKLLLLSRSKTKVLIYRFWPHPSIVHFFPALFSKVELDIFRNNINQNKWERPSNKYKYVCIARLHPDKNIELLIEATNYLCHDLGRNNFEITIVGDGPHRKVIENLINKYKINQNVKLMGSRVFVEVIKLLQDSNFLIMPGLNEGWGKVINEALASDCIPIVVKGGNAERAMQFMNNPGLLFDAKPNCLADIINQSENLSNEQRNDFLQKGRIANESLTLEKFKQKLVEVIAEVSK